jgi:hypothetical protein
LATNSQKIYWTISTEQITPQEKQNYKTFKATIEDITITSNQLTR